MSDQHDLGQDQTSLAEQPSAINPSTVTASLFNPTTSFFRALDNLAANAATHEDIDDLTIAITRRNIDLIFQVLTIPGFSVPHVNVREKEFIRKLYDPNPLLYAMKLQSMNADLDFGDGNGWSRAAVVAYLIAHPQEVTKYMSSRGHQGAPFIQAVPTATKPDFADPHYLANTTVAQAEAIIFAQEQDEFADNPALLSAVKLGLHGV